MRDRDAPEAYTDAASGRRILIGGAMLALLAAGLSVLAIRFKVPFTGLGAILVTFGGLAWISTALLRRRFAQFALRRGTR